MKPDKIATSSTTLLTKVGAWLSSNSPKKNYQAVDLGQAFDLKTNAFYNSETIGRQLFGAKGATAQSLATKIISQDKLDGIFEAFYNKIADASEMWATHALSYDDRFVRLNTLSDSEKSAFAKDVADQNRTLATLGGVTGFFGLKGVILDTAWLLVISLRTVYQLAYIYGVPLTGKDGFRLAYGVLSGANLDKLQEKQLILTALALGNHALTNADLKDEIDKAGGSTSVFASHADQIQELSKYINLEKYHLQHFGGGILDKILRLSAVAIGASYNHSLIDEVIGTALATFTTSSTLLLDDKTDNTDTPMA